MPPQPPLPRLPALPALILAVALAISLAATVPADAAPFPAGPEVTITTNGIAPDLAPQPEGFVAVWAEPASNRVLARLLDLDGQPRSAAIPVGLLDPGFPSGPPRVATDATGDFVVVWTGTPADGAEGAIFGRRFAADGTPLEPAGLLSGTGPLRRFMPRVDRAPDGRFLVAWSAEVGGASRTDTFARWFERDGSPEGSAFRVNTTTLREQEVTDVRMARGGQHAVVVWTHNGGEGVFGEVYAARVTPGAAGPEVHVNADPARTGTRQTDGQTIQLGDDTWWIVFHGFFQDGDEGAIVGRRFAPDLTPLTGDVVLNERTVGDQGHPAVTPLPAGDGFAVAWTDSCGISDFCDDFRESRDGSPAGIFGRVFAADGTPRTPDFQVPQSSHGLQENATLAANGSTILAAWANRELGSVQARPLADTACPGDGEAVCLHGGRFRVEMEWTDFQGGGGEAVGTVRGTDWATFRFVNPANVELGVKILDGRPVNGHWWVFFASLSNVGFTLHVTDLETGLVRSYVNPPRTFASRGDTLAFPSAPQPAGAEQAMGAGEAAAGAVGEGGITGHLVALPAAAVTGVDSGPCEPSPTRLCLQDDQFAVEMRWLDFFGNTGVGRGEELSADSGFFWFFRQGNPEVLVKVLDGRPVNGFYWVFFASMTNVAFDLEVTRVATGETVTYSNELRNFASRGDTTAFAPTPPAP